MKGDGTIPYGESELDKVLGSAFGQSRKGRARRLRVHRSREAGVGDYDSNSANVEGKVPGLVYAEGWQTQKGGMRGEDAKIYSEELDPKNCPPWLINDDCRNSISRLLEQTFKNFQQNTRLPSHINPPFQGRPIADKNTVILPAPGTGPATFTTVVCHTVPGLSRFRGELDSIGHLAESAAAWLDIEWRITLNGTPVEPYVGIIGQCFDWLHPTSLCTPIHMISQHVVCLEARALVGGPYEVQGRLCGWEYPVRVETGREIRSTIVD